MKALSLTIAFLGALAVAHADDLRAQIEASNKTITSAMKKKDFPALTKAMKGAMTSDFKYTEGGQAQSTETMLSNMKMGLGQMKTITVCSTKLLNLKQSGNTAAGTMQHTLAGTTMGQDKKMHKMTFSGVSADTYVKQGGHWRIASMTWKSQKTTMDGKSVAGMGG